MSDNDHLKFNGANLKIPDIARGTVIPYGIQRLELERKRAAAEKRADRRHHWAVAIVSTLLGAIAGGLAGYISALLTLKTG